MKERPPTFRAFVHEEQQFVLLMLGAFTFIALIHLVTVPDATRWRGRSVGEWNARLTSRIPEVRDSALVAISALQPDSASTIRISAAMLDDPSDYVAESAMETLILAGRRGGEPLERTLNVTIQDLRGDTPRGKSRAAHVLGAIGAPAIGALDRLVFLVGDSSEDVRAAAIAAIGSVLEGHPPSFEPEITLGAISVLAAATADPVSEVRDAAIEALFRAAPADVRLRNILEVARHDSSVDVRDRAAAVARGLARLDGHWTGPPL